MKTRVAVLRGGPSSEHEVSLKTGASVLANLDNDLYTPIDVLISKKGKWYNNGYELEPRKVIESSDVVFIALHGEYGEDGVVQRELDRYRIPYTGSGSMSSATAMNKLQTKTRLNTSGIKMAPHVRVKHDPSNNYQMIAASIARQFGPEFVIKPTNGGSSTNTLIVGEIELENAIRQIASLVGDVLIEKRIRGVEATCGVIENFREQDIYVLPVVEIVPPAANIFFDYEAKYSGKTEEICPGRFNSEVKKIIADAATVIHNELELSQYSRSDFIVADDGIYFLEVNTLPGLTEQSLFPVALGAVGASYKSFLEHLIEDAIQRK